MFIKNEELGKEIKRLRVANKMSQFELAKGICCQTTISGIEKGRTLPSVDILFYLSKRLNVTTDYLLTSTLHRTEHYVLSTEELINNYLKTASYPEILEITTLEREWRKKRNLGEEFNQFIDWHFYRSSYATGNIGWQLCVDKLTLLINDKSILKQPFQDLKIKNAIANILSENGLFNDALNIYKELLSHNLGMESYQRFKLKIYFNLAKMHFFEMNYNESLVVAKKGIVESLRLEDISVLGQLYTQSAQSIKQLEGYNGLVKDYLDKAKVIFILLKREAYVEFVDSLQKDLEKERN
ncbi:helix-turn-helix transcriptional regulator [Sutcliffiella horikoshii]|uniref:Helix-turn-helix transcriptional regulator n=1 Tax=Sutcliffiella horikoshii TaxID=79883 RepID=A0A5D4SZL2_9BACI|nr:helix-turn-helix domain-containing protein [Sutcliffiella horikoshii]TYS67672.1 helix-turn-helix transcriptional regulator [Sutcliffiella horikoshii]